MFEETTDTLTKMGAQITTAEIKQQPDLWLEAFANYEKEQATVSTFLTAVASQAGGGRSGCCLLGPAAHSMSGIPSRRTCRRTVTAAASRSSRLPRRTLSQRLATT